MPTEPLAPTRELPKLLEVSHVAHRLNASHEFVRRLIRGKQLAAIHMGTRWRVDPVDLEAYIDAQRQHAALPDAPVPRSIRALTMSGRPLTAAECGHFMGYSAEWVRGAVAEGVRVEGLLVRLQGETLATSGRSENRIEVGSFVTFLRAINWMRLR